MKKIGKILAVAALAMVSYSASAELAPQWTKGTLLADVEFGVAPGFGGSIAVDYVLFDDWWKGHFSVGGEIDMAKPYKYDTVFGVSPRATYGLNITDQFEVHAMAQMGFGFRKYDDDVYKENHTHILHSEMVGCRFFFTDGIAVMAETGFSNWLPELRAGICFKF